MVSNVIVLAQARTGSSLLCDIFNSLEPCRNLSELFLSYKFAENPKNLAQVPHRYFLNISEQLALAKKFNILHSDYVSLLKCLSNDPEVSLDYLDDIIPVTKIIKILDHQMEYINVDIFLKNENIKFVLLERTNKLEQFVSYDISVKTGQWVNTNTSEIKVYVDADKFIEFVNNSQNWYHQIKEKLEKNDKNFLEINYEKDLNCNDLGPITKTIKDWLSSQNVNTDIKNKKIHYTKQNLLPLSEKILNFTEIANKFPEYV